MIRRLRVHGYKSLADVGVELAPITVLFGPNAAGKSNLLDAVNLLARMVTSENLEEAFSQHRGTPLEAFSFPSGGVSELMAQGKASFTMEADVELSEEVRRRVGDDVAKAREGLSDGKTRQVVVSPRLRYRLTVEILTESGHLRVMDERLDALKADGTPDANRHSFIWREPGEPRIRLRREGQGHPLYEELGQDRPIASKRLYPPHYPHICALGEELSRWRTYYLEPSAMRAEAPLREVTILPSDGSDLAGFYNTVRARRPKQLVSFERALAEIVPNATSIRVEHDRAGLLHLEVDEGGVAVSSRVVSEGTLRLLGLLAVTNPLEPLSVVGYEEPENGVHADRLSMVGRVLLNAAERGSTQYLVNTHSPLLPEYFLGEPVARVIRCSRHGRDTRFEALGELNLFSEGAITEGLAEPLASTFGQRMVRGDFR
ncbi:MAG: AAA family ATPase [Acidimicrobiales bacterium]